MDGGRSGNMVPTVVKSDVYPSAEDESVQRHALYAALMAYLEDDRRTSLACLYRDQSFRCDFVVSGPRNQLVDLA